jgi:Dyp-type peroxidase family
VSAEFEQLEPVLHADEIQGNILGGFNKDHQAILPLSFGADVGLVREWLKALLPSITWLREVVDYKRERRRRISRTAQEPTDMAVVWRNLAFSYQGLRKLTPQADAFEATFRNGMSPGESASLGDPVNAGDDGNISSWVVGKPGNVPDALAIIAGDVAGEVDSATDLFLARAAAAGITCPHVDIGHDLAHYNGAALQLPSGREHFGFEDGISQPGIRGRLSSAPDDFLTPRLPDDGDPNSAQPQFSAPGQPLVCAGEFVLGYSRQNASFGRRAAPPWPLGPEPFAPDPEARAPFWAKNGSFLVYRRLRQDVPAFNRFLVDAAAKLAQQDPAFAGLTTETLGALLVGRWHSGAPLLRTPTKDLPGLGAQSGANNAFGFATAVDPHDGFPPAALDPLGRVCPQSAHIRKVNPRDLDTDQGPANTTLVHRILRRGIPFGPPLPLGATEDPTNQERGLLFLCYQTSISDQFRFLTTRWMNDRSKPSTFSPPNGSGFDMILGQNPSVAENRTRFLCVGPSNEVVSTEGQPIQEWVIPTGGGYFFAPSRAAIRDVLMRD